MSDAGDRCVSRTPLEAIAATIPFLRHLESSSAPHLGLEQISLSPPTPGSCRHSWLSCCVVLCSLCFPRPTGLERPR